MSGALNAGIVVRAAGDADITDITDILAIWAANGDTIPEGGANVLTPYLLHLMSTGRVLVAADDDGAVGFGAVIERAGVTHLADLFVLPDRFGQGTGALLLDRLFADTAARTTFASSDPRALPLYVRSGMTPYWPNLYLDGDSAALPPDAPGLVCKPAGLDTTIELEQGWLGASTPDDHHFWAALPEARPFVVVQAGRPIAAVHARLRRTGVDRWINRLVMSPDADPVAVLVAAYRHAAEGGRIGSCLPGPSPALRPLLESGWRIIDQDTFMASNPALFDATRRISDGGIL
jgi:GNAT superfamily N-acetyltransferase